MVSSADQHATDADGVDVLPACVSVIQRALNALELVLGRLSLADELVGRGHLTLSRAEVLEDAALERGGADDDGQLGLDDLALGRGRCGSGLALNRRGGVSLGRGLGLDGCVGVLERPG